MAKLSNRLTSALAPLGVVALVAGCGGGSMVAGGNGSTTFVPPGPSTAQTSKATLTLYVPARKGSANTRSPRYVSPGTAKVTVAVAQAGAVSPWPNPTSTSVPTPGPSPLTGTPTPIPVTMTVNAPVGNAQFAVNTYDVSGQLLSGVTSTPVPISSNAAANTITLTLNAAAECMQIDSQPNTMSTPAAVSFYPFVNQTAAQTSTFVVTPCDIDGYAIPAGQKLGNSLVFTTTNPKPPALSSARQAQADRHKQNLPVVSFSPSVITNGGPTTVTMTEPAGGGSDVQYLEPSDSNSQYATITTTPVFYVLTANTGSNDVSVITASANDYGTGTAVRPVSVAGVPNALVGGGPQSGCLAPGQAVTGNDGGGTFSVLTIPSPSAANPTPLPSPATVTGLVPASPAPPVLMMDGSCIVFAGLSDGKVSTLTGHLSTFTGDLFGPFSDPSDGSPTFTAYGSAPITALGFLGSTDYVGLGPSSGGYMNSMVTTANASLYPGFAAPGSVKAGTVDAIAPYDSTHVVVAYHDTSGGYLHFALYDGTTTTQDANTYNFWTVTSISADTTGNVWGVASGLGSLIQYIPATPTVSTQSLTAVASPQPGGVAVAPNGKIYVTDTGANNVSVYDWNYTVYNALGYTGTQISVGTAPKSVIVLP